MSSYFNQLNDFKKNYSIPSKKLAKTKTVTSLAFRVNHTLNDAFYSFRENGGSSLLPSPRRLSSALNPLCLSLSVFHSAMRLLQSIYGTLHLRYLVSNFTFQSLLFHSFVHFFFCFWTGHHKSVGRFLARRCYAASTEDYAKRNYANNASEYNTVVSSITSQRRYFLLRDVYEDLTLDGVQPTRDLFHSLIVGTMKGSRLQDAFFFRDQMKATGLLPDVCSFFTSIPLR